MYEIIRQVIQNGGYKLTGIQQKVKRMYILGDLNAGQMDELLSLAEAGAASDAERPEALAMIRSLAARVEAVEAKIAELDGSSGGQTEAHPEWTAWDGMSSNYQPGAIVSHGGKLWRSVYAGQNVWEPGVAGDGFWVEYTEPESVTA